MSQKHKVYVYGTLRPGGADTVQVPGRIYDLGWFPGAKLELEQTEITFTAEIISADDNKLKELDHYEGYDADHPAHSLYLRVPYQDGWIYVYNNDLSSRPMVESGDWLEHTSKGAGVNSQLVATN